MNHVEISNDNAVAALHAVYPEHNWAWFLAQNRYGLTNNYPTIPFKLVSNEILYDLADIRTFAKRFGKGKYTAGFIRKVTEGFSFDYELQSLLTELNGFSEANETMAIGLDDYCSLIARLKALAVSQRVTRDELLRTPILSDSSRTISKKSGNVEVTGAAAISILKQAEPWEINAKILSDIADKLMLRFSPTHFLNEKMGAQ